MQTTLNTLSSLNINAGTSLEEFLESGIDYLSDWKHERADGDANVIYYAKAEALYAEASLDERVNAEAMVEVSGGFGEGATMPSRFCTLAYWITYARLETEVRKELAVSYTHLRAHETR